MDALMCGRFTLICSAKEIGRALGVSLSDKELSLYRTSRGYNVAPSQNAPIVLMQDGKREIVPAKWGFHPGWAREDAPSPINARVETVFDKPFFRNAIRRNRCLIPATGWYEWQSIAQGQKQPYFIRPADTRVFAFAGVYEEREEDPGSTFAILVGEAAPEIRTLHARQPIVVKPEDYEAWLAPKTPQDRLKEILTYRESNYDREAVTKMVNNPRNDSPDILGSSTLL